MILLFLWSLSSTISALSHTLAPSSAPDTSSQCVLQNDFDPGFVADGDFIIGGIFTLHYNQEMPDVNFTSRPTAVKCNEFDQRSFRWVLAMRLAVEEINQSEKLLPNHTLGYKIFDSCAYPLTTQRAALAMLNGPGQVHKPICSGASPLLAVIGESGSAESIVVSRNLQLFSIPMVKAIAQLLVRYGWSWVGVIRADHVYGLYALQGLLKELRGTGVCVAYQETIPLFYNQQKALKTIEVMRSSTVRVVVVFTSENEITPFLKDYMEQNITGIQWVASEAWVTSSVFATSRYYPYLGGTIGFGIKQGQIPGLKDYMQTINPGRYPSNPLVHELWEALYGCSPSTSPSPSNTLLPPCSGQETLLDKYSAYMNASSPRVTYNVYKSVYAIAHSLHNLVSCQSGTGPFHNHTCANSNNVYPWQLQHYLQEVNFSFAGEIINFDLKGDSVSYYDIINWQRGSGGNIEFITVGVFDGTKDSGKELVIQEEKIEWAGHQSEVVVSVCSASCPPGFRKAVRHGEPLCCFDCVPCDGGKISNQTDSIDCKECPEDYWSNGNGTLCIPKVVEFLSDDAMGIALMVIAVMGACLTVSILAVFLHYRTTPIIRINNSELSFSILLSLTLCFLCALVFIGEPTSWSCMLRHTAFSITFSLCISCILGKTLVVLAAFTATRPGNNVMKWLGPKQQRIIIFCCTLVQVLICAAWLIAAPPFPYRNTQADHSKIILECSVSSQLAFWCVLGYIGFLACLCFILAFLARKLPGNFNEARFITFSMLIFCAVWISFIPAYVSSPGKFTVAVEIFAILASSFGLLFCLFASKCYIILLKPENNTKQHIMGNKK
ncbi:hypothetical protein UPYG_G00205030 [Umbra pygmaea]|uniref:G-protein coupled receptors family 3 profile domain-containing protein n=1 Tax=Umbra pygmaea TaxID=75934 RepID=A0ABD0WKK3_UMBPY